MEKPESITTEGQEDNKEPSADLTISFEQATSVEQEVSAVQEVGVEQEVSADLTISFEQATSVEQEVSAVQEVSAQEEVGRESETIADQEISAQEKVSVVQEVTADLEVSVLRKPRVEQQDDQPFRDDLRAQERLGEFSQAIWQDLQSCLQQHPVIKDEDENTFSFEPYISQLVAPSESFEKLGFINAIIDKEPVDLEKSYKWFVGKRLADFDFSDEAPTFKAPWEETLHGEASNAGKFDVERLMREVEDVVVSIARINQPFQEQPAVVDHGAGDFCSAITSDLIKNKNRIYEKVKRAANLRDGDRVLTEFQTFEPGTISVKQLENVGEACAWDINSLRRSEINEFNETLANLEARLAYLKKQVEAPSELMAPSEFSPNRSLKEIVAGLFEAVRLSDDVESERLETELKTVESQLALLEACEPRPDSSNAKADLERLGLNSDVEGEIITELLAATKDDLHYPKLVDELSQELLSADLESLESLDCIARIESLHSSLSAMLRNSTNSIARTENLVNAHKNQLESIQKAFKV